MTRRAARQGARPTSTNGGFGLRRPGAGAALDRPGLCRRQAASRGRSRCASMPPAPTTAGPSCPAASPASARPSIPPPSPCSAAARRPTSGWCPTSRSSASRCCPSRAKSSSASRSARLPSRAADNLIWLGRYAERCEATVRILRAYNARLAEVSNPDLPILKDTRAYLEQHRRRCRGRPAAGLLALHRQRRLQRQPDPRPLLARRLAGAHRPAEDRAATSPPASSPATTRPAR